MKLPYLKSFDNCYIDVKVTQGHNQNGVPIVLEEYVGTCNFNEKTVTSYDKDGKKIRLNGTVVINGDIAPSAKKIEGKVTIDEVDYRIHSGARIRNLDGSVHHTYLELI